MLFLWITGTSAARILIWSQPSNYNSVTNDEIWYLYPCYPFPGLFSQSNETDILTWEFLRSGEWENYHAKKHRGTMTNIYQGHKILTPFVFSNLPKKKEFPTRDVQVTELTWKTINNGVIFFKLGAIPKLHFYATGKSVMGRWQPRQ